MGPKSAATKERAADVHEQRVVAYGELVSVTNELTRPADVTAYGAGDAVADSTSAPTIREFTNAGRYAGASGYVVGAVLLTSNTSWQNAAMRLWLYNTDTGVDLVNDNAQFNGPAYGDKALLVGYIDFPAFLGEAGTLSAIHSIHSDLRLPFKLDAAETSLFGLWQVKTAATPASAQTFYCKLYIDQN